MAEHEQAADLPPVPAVRHITPAPEDFENPPPIANLLWPLVWAGIAGLLWMITSSLGWHEWAGH